MINKKSEENYTNRILASVGVGLVTGILHYLLTKSDDEEESGVPWNSILWGTMGGLLTALVYPTVESIAAYNNTPNIPEPKKKSSTPWYIPTTTQTAFGTAGALYGGYIKHLEMSRSLLKPTRLERIGKITGAGLKGLSYGLVAGWLFELLVPTSGED